jgi:hypothetical protein
VALIDCPECEEDVSTSAQSCPNCGYQPIPAPPEQRAHEEIEEAAGSLRFNQIKTYLIVASGGGFSLVIGLVFWAQAMGSPTDTTSNDQGEYDYSRFESEVQEHALPRIEREIAEETEQPLQNISCSLDGTLLKIKPNEYRGMVACKRKHGSLVIETVRVWRDGDQIRWRVQ